ncbi:hypothetical protein EU538_04370 [Candidatus Thorarchaeota archaeon]|nr:MAG: hypothetical protein EU538_04370 [Candidatus Thorarchaeota archaeon]
MKLSPLLEKAKNVLILGHQNADPDAVSSMYALSRIHRHLNPGGESTLACDDMSKISAQVLQHFDCCVEITDAPQGEFDLIVLLDTNSRLQLGDAIAPYVTDPSRTVIIDHHEPNPETKEISEFIILDSEKSSTCEMMVDIFHDLDIPIDSQTANLLLTGMIFDTRRFFYANRATLEAAVVLIDNGANYDECVKSLISRIERSERIARLKAAGRLKIHNIGKWVVVTSKIGAYEASSCRALIDVGADVAIVGGRPSRDVVRLSSRSTREFSRETGINLGKDVMEPLGETIGGTGGGHMNAAGANGNRNRGKALKQAVELIRQSIAIRRKEDSS